MTARRWFAYDAREKALEGGINDKWWVKHQSLGRESSDDSPYLLTNEVISSEIGRFLRLPIPPFALMRKHHEKGMFVSWKFGSHGVTPDDVDPPKCFQEFPEICAGVLVFDVFVANSDRHVGNIKVDDPINPTKMEVFDHDHALFGAIGGHGKNRLNKHWAASGLEGNHCFADQINDFDLIGPWMERIYTIPDWFIDALCDEAAGLDATQDELDLAKMFLKDRRKNFPLILDDCKGEFPRIRNWPMI